MTLDQLSSNATRLFFCLFGEDIELLEVQKIGTQCMILFSLKTPLSENQLVHVAKILFTIEGFHSFGFSEDKVILRLYLEGWMKHHD